MRRLLAADLARVRAVRRWATLLVVTVSLLVGCGEEQAGPEDRAEASRAAEPSSTPRPTKVPSKTPSGEPSASSTSYRHFEEVGYVEGTVLDANDSTVLVSRTDGSQSIATYTPEGKLLGELVLGDTCGEAVLSPADDSTVYVPEQSSVPAAGLEEERTVVEVVAYDASLTELWRRTAGDSGVSEVSDFACVESGTNLMRVTGDGVGVSYTLSDGTATLLTADGRSQKDVPWTPVPLGSYWGTFDGLCANCLTNLRQVDVVDPSTFAVVASHSARDVPADEYLEEGSLVQVLTELVAAATGDLPSSAFLPDGRRAVVADGRLRIVDVVTGEIAVAGPETAPDGFVYPLDDVIVTQSGDFADTPGTRGYSMDLTRLWSQEAAASVCDARDGQVVVEANGQLVLLDATTGEQLDFTDVPATCDGPVAGGFLYSSDGTVYRLTDTPS